VTHNEGRRQRAEGRWQKERVKEEGIKDYLNQLFSLVLCASEAQE